jgi:hypothetical protein
VASNGPPPPSVNALAWTALAIWLFVPWAWWLDKHRVLVLPTSRQDNAASTPISPA